jgi:hypothetical protein
MEVQTQPRYVKETIYARMAGLSPQSLRNWRHRDRQAGRTEAAPGYPRYRYFGGAVRYLLSDFGEVNERPAA